MKSTQLSVTNFLHCGDDYLFILRDSNRLIDAGKLNGIGGKLEPDEDYLSAAIRETKEETGYLVSPKDIQFSGIVNITGGYEDDWVMCFYKIEVPTKDIPLGNVIPEGKLLWLPKNKVLTSGYELVDDLHYLWDKIVLGEGTFFMHASVNAQEKITHVSLTDLPK